MLLSGRGGTTSGRRVALTGVGAEGAVLVLAPVVVEAAEDAVAPPPSSRTNRYQTPPTAATRATATSATIPAVRICPLDTTPEEVA